MVLSRHSLPWKSFFVWHLKHIPSSYCQTKSFSPGTIEVDVSKTQLSIVERIIGLYHVLKAGVNFILNKVY